MTRPLTPSAHRRPQFSDAFSARCCVCIGILALTSSACDGPPPANDGERTLDAGTTGPPNANVKLRFEEPLLKLTPGATEELVVHATPAGKYPLQLALIGDGVSAFLDQNTATTNSDGSARFQLSVPSDGDFDVLATFGNAQATLEVRVAPAAVGTLNVTPVYSGVRQFDEWSVSTSTSANCDDLTDYEDGETFASNQNIQLTNVPASTPLKLLIRGAHFVLGCKDIELLPGVENSTDVNMSDRPIQLETVDLPLSFAFERTQKFADHLEAIIAKMNTAFASTATDTAAILEMMGASTSRSVSFNAAELDGAWASLTQAHLLARAESETLIRARLDVLIRQGTEQLFAPAAFVGRLTGLPGTPNAGSFSLATLAGVPVEHLDITSMPAPNATLTSTPPETGIETEEWLRAGYELSWRPSILLGKLAVGRITTNIDSGLGPELDVALDCETLATALSATTTGSNFEFSPVELTELCRDSLHSMWTAALDADTGLISLVVGAAGPALVDGYARPQGFAGDWAGALTHSQEASEPLSVRGPFFAEASPPEP